MIKFKAKIKWLTNNASGHPIITDLPYRPIIVFKDEKICSEAIQPIFSAEVFNKKVRGKTSISLVEVKCKEMSTKIGIEFDLYEVSKKVAYGEIIAC